MVSGLLRCPELYPVGEPRLQDAIPLFFEDLLPSMQLNIKTNFR